MKKWTVRWEVEGFVTKESFGNKKEALKYYNKILDKFGYWTTIDIYED